MPALPQDPHAKPEIAVRMEANEHRHALARVIAGPDAGDDEVSFGHGKKRQLRHADQPAHVPGRRRRNRKRHFEPAPAVPPEAHQRQALVAAIDRHRLHHVDGANLREHQPPHTCMCAREVERRRARRRRDQPPFRCGRHRSRNGP
ncbi:hypothetical protein [Mesorhizobium sp. M7A.T.Ca.US.000.02.1.1]|uniref:hypothetical protein n=1 Tax=Mesorhizobium sp. M7A.T.Ca.US.000.02.1.1 TaxID=2496792 RepID=UPI0013E3BE3E|nr:hypothetical protein [Mesorhizobium sp. M7A.T.Ca.US.000.02.1.1]